MFCDSCGVLRAQRKNNPGSCELISDVRGAMDETLMDGFGKSRRQGNKKYLKYSYPDGLFQLNNVQA
jgi:hypothetical protein